MTDAVIDAIEQRVRPTICQTFSTGRAPSVEGRITEDDLDVLLTAARGVAAERCLIWSNEHRAWWRPNSCGYTTHLAAAGRYSQAEAAAICRAARGGWKEGTPPPEIPVREADALGSSRFGQ